MNLMYRNQNIAKITGEKAPESDFAHGMVMKELIVTSRLIIVLAMTSVVAGLAAWFQRKKGILNNMFQLLILARYGVNNTYKLPGYMQ